MQNGSDPHITKETELKPGDRLLCEEGGQWWNAEVLEVRKDGKVKVHFIGWGSDWDTVVPRSRLKLGYDAKVKGQRPVETGDNLDDVDDDLDDEEYGDGKGPVASDALFVSVNGVPVRADTPLSVGQALIAEQEGQWWDAEVLELCEDGRVKVHYVGWERSWDEVVPRIRLRLGMGAAKRVTAHVENHAPLAGALLETTHEFIVLASPEGNRRLFVNKGKVLYLEVEDSPEHEPLPIIAGGCSQ